MKSQKVSQEATATVNVDEYLASKIAIGAKFSMDQETVRGAIADFKEDLRSNLESPSSHGFASMAAAYHGSSLFNNESNGLHLIANGLKRLEPVLNLRDSQIE